MAKKSKIGEGVARTDSAGMQYFAKQVASAMNSKKTAAPKILAPKGPSIAERRAAEVKDAYQYEKTRSRLSPIKAPIGLSKPDPKAINATPSRTYTEKEKQINALLMTGKKKDGTMKASAQRKIQKIRRK
jgi:hypothetical protein